MKKSEKVSNESNTEIETKQSFASKMASKIGNSVLSLVKQNVLCNHTTNWEHIEGEPLCHQKRICSKCKKEDKRVCHEYVDIAKDPMRPCVWEKKCAHCGEIEVDSIEHHYEINRVENCENIGKCKKCGDEMVLGKVHRWRIVRDKKNKIIEGECQDCGTKYKK